MRGERREMTRAARTLAAVVLITTGVVRAHDDLAACVSPVSEPPVVTRTEGAYAYRFAAWESSGVTASDTPTPDADPCEMQCRHRSDQALQACLSSGSPLTQCVSAAQSVLGQCLISECGRPPFEAPCELTCHWQSQQVYAVCSAAGHAADACAAQAREALNQCLAGVCGLAPQVSPCIFACHQSAESAFQQCLAVGGARDGCTALAREKLNGCLENECHVAAPESACVTACHRQAEQMFRGCLEAGATHASCAEEARTLMEACQRVECGLPPLVPPCETRCEQDGEDVYYDCLRNGHGQTECAEIARALRQDCLVDRCGLDPGCDAYCPRKRMGDPRHDSVPRRRDRRGALSMDPSVVERSVELLETAIGAWAPANPAIDLFVGQYRATGGFVRLDLRFAGVVNPPGSVEPASFKPHLYGPRPLYGFVELDMDANLGTGGELDAPQYRYPGNVARFGGQVSAAAFRNRVATDVSAFDRNFLTPPFVERSGEEFHLALLGGEAVSIRELHGDGDALFERGEAWLLTGAYFHRAHGYERFSLAEGGRSPGQYTPQHKILFSHDVIQDVTTVSVVFPLTNAAAGLVNGRTPEPMNGNPSDQASVLEALEDLHESALFLNDFPTSDPAQMILSPWANQAPSNYLNPTDWRVTVLVGTNHPVVEPSQALFLWTDLFPNVVAGDVDGSGARTEADAQSIRAFVVANDGRDGRLDGSVLVREFSAGFSLFDVNYDGVVDLRDVIRDNGDSDADDDIDLADFATQQVCFGRAGAFTPCVSVNFDGDDTVDLNDVRVMGWSLEGPGRR